MRASYAGFTLLLLVSVLASACGADEAPTTVATPLVAKTPPPVVTVLASAATVAAERLPLTVQLMPVDALISHAMQLSERDLPTAQPGGFLYEDIESVELSEEEASEYVGYIPPRFVFVRARLYKAPTPEWISITYRRGINELLFVEEQPFGANPWAPIEFTDTITVNGESAYVIRGGAAVSASSENREAFWDPSAFLAIYFRSGEKVFTIRNRGDGLTTDELVRIAESAS